MPPELMLKTYTWKIWWLWFVLNYSHRQLLPLAKNKNQTKEREIITNTGLSTCCKHKVSQDISIAWCHLQFVDKYCRQKRYLFCEAFLPFKASFVPLGQREQRNKCLGLWSQRLVPDFCFYNFLAEWSRKGTFLYLKLTVMMSLNITYSDPFFSCVYIHKDHISTKINRQFYNFVTVEIFQSFYVQT